YTSFEWPSARAKPRPHGLDGQQHDEGVKKQRAVLDVIKIVLDFFACAVDIGRITLTNLGPAGNARLDHMAVNIKRQALVEVLDKLGLLRPGPDQAHVAFQNIDELRQLVYAVFTYHTPHPGNARVVFLGKLRIVDLVAPTTHAAQLVHLERLVAPAHAFLHIQRRPRTFQ